MPGPPPPPPPGMMPPPPPPTPAALPKVGKADDRAALLKSIQKGAKLKKTVTNDRSAPSLGGKSNNAVSNNSNHSSSSNTGVTANPTSNGFNPGDLFSGGMPRLKPTGKLSVANHISTNNNVNSNNNKRPAVPPQPVKNSSSLQSELKKQLAVDSRNRGPPPPAPVRHSPDENGDRQMPKMAPTNGLHSNQSSLHSNHSSLHSNLHIHNNGLHRKVKSNVSLSSLDSTDAVNGFSLPNKPVISHGKPNLAPKPPVLNVKPATPPKKLVMNGKPISRAHSMRSPRSPSPQSPDSNFQPKFGTVRNLSSVIGQSLANSTGNLSPKPRPILNGRPNAPPPSVPSQQPPPPPPHATKPNPVKPPNHAPPPPPSHTPPPPPHRMVPSRAPPPLPNSHAPPPPPRHSSMAARKGGTDLEEKCRGMFHDPNTFPKPPPYRNVFKYYGIKQAGSKQQAPQPPCLQSSSRTWDNSSTC